MAKPSKFAHVVYSTRRFEEMVDWYRAVFEATVAYQNPAFAFLTYDDEHHRFAFANLSLLSPNGAAETRGKEGINHVAYTYASLGDLLATYERLKEMCVLPYWRIHHGITCCSITGIRTAIEWSFKLMLAVWRTPTPTCAPKPSPRIQPA